jgi:hypothetical protein
LLGDDVFDGKLWTEGVAQHLYPLPKAYDPVCLTRQRIVLVILDHGKLIESGDVPSVEDVCVIPAHDSFVLFGWHGSGSFQCRQRLVCVAIVLCAACRKHMGSSRN